MSTQPPVVWRSGKLTILRPFESDDVATIYRGINDPSAYPFLSNTAPKGRAYEEAWIKKNQEPSPDRLVVAICLRDGTMIGAMGLHKCDLLHGTATTGSVLFAEEHRNQGYGTDAKMVLLDYAFNFMNLYLVESEVMGFNDRSAAYSSKCGYVEEARLRDRYLRFGKRHDKIIMSVTRAEWEPCWQRYQNDCS